MELILGSTSPRRKEILSSFKLPFKVQAPLFDEDEHPPTDDPRKFAMFLSEGKARSIENKNAIVLTADTIVYREGRYFGKPKSREESIEFLEALSGKWHSVFTAVTLLHEGSLFSEVEEAKVEFCHITRKEIEKYIDSLHLQDKAGGYQIQLPGGLIVRQIHGCYTNVLGLPIHTVRSLLKKVGIDLWDRLS